MGTNSSTIGVPIDITSPSDSRTTQAAASLAGSVEAVPSAQLGFGSEEIRCSLHIPTPTVYPWIW